MSQNKYDWTPDENFANWRTVQYNPSWHAYTALIAIDRPQEYNCYILGTLKELSRAFELAMADDSVQFVVMTGTGDKAFCTGGNVNEYAEIYNRYPWGFWNWGEHYGRVFDMILHCGMPVIARVNGVVAGGGWEFVACCDLAIASENARFISPGPRVGMTSIGGLSQWLPLHMGIKKASEMVLLSREINANEALELGVVNEVVPIEKLDDKVKEYIDKMITLSPSSLHYFKTHINWWKDLVWRLTWEHGKAWFASNIGAMEPSEGLWSFKEKRKSRMKDIRDFRAKGGDPRVPFGPYIRKCEKCGADFLPLDSKYCLNCGAKFE